MSASPRTPEVLRRSQREFGAERSRGRQATSTSSSIGRNALRVFLLASEHFTAFALFLRRHCDSTTPLTRVKLHIEHAYVFEDRILVLAGALARLDSKSRG